MVAHEKKPLHTAHMANASTLHWRIPHVMDAQILELALDRQLLIDILLHLGVEVPGHSQLHNCLGLRHQQVYILPLNRIRRVWGGKVYMSEVRNALVLVRSHRC